MPKADEALAADLLADPKERAEHVMLVDLGRNDIGRVCQYGSVKVPEFFIIERYSHVMHIVSHVEGKLRPELSAFDLVRAGLPCRDGQRRAQGARHGDHRRTRTGRARTVRRHGRLLRLRRRHGHLHRHPHAGGARQNRQRPGRRRHRGRLGPRQPNTRKRSTKPRR
jgi:hypothetical protein